MDHIRVVQNHLRRGENEAQEAIKQALQEHLEWINMFCSTAKLELRRPSINGKKRRLNLTDLSDGEEIQPKRSKPNELPALNDKVIVIESSDDDNESVKSFASTSSVQLNPSKLRVPQLRKELSKRNMSTVGLKAKLVQRLTAALKAEQAEDAPIQRDIPEKDKMDNEDDDVIVPFLKSKSVVNAAKKPLPPSPVEEEKLVKAPEVVLVEEPPKESIPVEPPKPIARLLFTESMIDDSIIDETPMKSPERPPPVLHSPGKVHSKEKRKRKTLFPSPQSASRGVDLNTSLSPIQSSAQHNVSMTDDHQVSFGESENIVSTAVSLFTSPLVKGFASLKSAFGLNSSDNKSHKPTPVEKLVKQVEKATEILPKQTMEKVLENPPPTPIEPSPKSNSPSKTLKETQYRDLVDTIKHNSNLIRLQAKEKAKKRLEEESRAVASIATETPTTTQSIPDEPANTSTTSNTDNLPKKPLNLVSGVHSFASLVQKEAPKPTPAPVAIPSLKLAERNKLLEQKRAAEKLQRGQELLRKLEEQRKLAEEKRKKAAAAAAEQRKQQERERELAEKKLREVEVAKKRAARLQAMQAAAEDDGKRRQEKLNRERLELAKNNRKNELLKKPEHEAKKPASTSAKPVLEAKKLIGSKPPELVSKPKPLTEPKSINSNKPTGNSSKSITKPAVTTYQMSEPESDESDGGGEAKAVPEWAQKENLEKALARQFGPHAIDPTPSIFPEFIATCDLEAIFKPKDGAKKKKFARRTSSGNWLADRPTTREKIAYKKAMGYTS